jgi:Sensors of blue-light using FAD
MCSAGMRGLCIQRSLIQKTNKNLMVRLAQLLQTTVFLSVDNPLTQMADTQAWMQGLAAQAGSSSVTGMVLAGSDRWLCLLEGEPAHVESMALTIERHVRPRAWHILMTDAQATVRFFPQHRIGWRADSTLLEMAAFLGDLRRAASSSQVWHTSTHAVAALLEPSD